MHVIFDNNILGPSIKKALCLKWLAHLFIDTFRYPLWCMLIKLVSLRSVKGSKKTQTKTNQQQNISNSDKGNI